MVVMEGNWRLLKMICLLYNEPDPFTMLLMNLTLLFLQIFSISLFERTQNLKDFIKQNYKNKTTKATACLILNWTVVGQYTN